MMYEKESLVAFGVRLRELRKAALMKQVKLAELAGVSQATISRVENGTYPTLTTRAVARLAGALECSRDRLLDGTGFVPLDTVPYEWRTKPTWKQ